MRPLAPLFPLTALAAVTVLTAFTAAAFAQDSPLVQGRTADMWLVDPVTGQVTAYDTGALEIMALRQLAESRLGEAFDIREFHDEVLRNDAVPLDVLEAKIERWMQ